MVPSHPRGIKSTMQGVDLHWCSEALQCQILATWSPHSYWSKSRRGFQILTVRRGQQACDAVPTKFIAICSRPSLSLHCMTRSTDEHCRPSGHVRQTQRQRERDRRFICGYCFCVCDDITAFRDSVTVLQLYYDINHILISTLLLQQKCKSRMWYLPSYLSCRLSP